MPLGLTEEHRDLADSLQRLAREHASRTATRAEMEPLSQGQRPECWSALVAHGFLAMHVPESVGGGGAELVDLAVVVEEAGRALIPGHFIPTVLAAALLGDAGGTALDRYGSRIASGEAAACALNRGELVATSTAEGLVVQGRATAVLGAPGADFLVLGARSGGEDVWFVAEPSLDSRVTIEAATALDTTRSIGTVLVDGLLVTPDRLLTGMTTARARAIAAVVLSAEASGIARWCFDTALDYIRVREQFGRPVGSFQALKHKAATLFVRVELLAAAAWDAARAVSDSDEQLQLAASGAALLCLAGARETALDAITMLGGIGFTWEHDITLYWRRAVATAQLLGPPSSWAAVLGSRVGSSTRRFTIELSSDTDSFRQQVRANLEQAAALGEPARRRVLSDCGYVAPQYPAPHGLGATPAQQLVINQEFQRIGIPQPSTIIGEFALPTILAHGDEAQKKRFITPTLQAEIVWCQLFSEPEAGSDLASLRARAEKVPGGWRITGQKVWTSKAHEAHWGICLARTDPDVPKHKGISYFLVDMASEGIDIRPLRQSTGQAEFNEVFLDDVFVPDECLIGEPGDGWKIATTTLANERLAIASGRTSASGLVQLLQEMSGNPAMEDNPQTRVTLGRLAADGFALEALNLRSLILRLKGLEPGAASSVQKLASTEYRRALATAALELAGSGAAIAEPGSPSEEASNRYLSLPAILVGGGTREIQLNVVAERILGLPRG